MVYLPLDIPCITHPRAHGRGVRLHLAAVATRLPQRTYRHHRTGSVLHTACRAMPQEPDERHPTGRADGHDDALRRSTSTKGGLSNDSTPAPDDAQLLGRAHALAPEAIRVCAHVFGQESVGCARSDNAKSPPPAPESERERER